MRNRLLVVFVFLSLSAFGFAQGIQGSVKLSGKAVVNVTGHTVTLTWNASPGAASYNVYRSTTHNGPYSKLASGVTNTTFIDVKVLYKQTFYYVTTAVSGNYESGYSNEAVVTLP